MRASIALDLIAYAHVVAEQRKCAETALTAFIHGGAANTFADAALDRVDAKMPK